MSTIKQIFELSELIEDLSYQDFENLVFDIVSSNPAFKNTVKSKAGKDRTYDIFADELISENIFCKAIFEVKKVNLLTTDYIIQIGSHWKKKNWNKTSKLYIVTSGSVTNKAKKTAEKYSIQLWDVYELYKLITPEIENKYYDLVSNEYYEPEIVETREQNLSTALETLEKGKTEWSTYQILAGDILSHLFVPPLSTPRFEHSDLDGKNRRDIIFENSTEHPFWKGIRDIYKGDYIVVDAKNYTNSIEKRPIIDIAHYLKPYGCGMFGIILTRVGTSQSAEHAIKEQWIGNGKMIVVLNDKDLLEMLRIKQVNGKPEEIIKMKLADFRMSL